MLDEDNRIQKFDGRRSDDYNLWRIRAVTALKGKGFWSNLQKKDCDSGTKEKAVAILVNSLGDSALRVCSEHVDDPLKMINALDSRFASTRATTRISVMTALYTKRYSDKEDMTEYVDGFESLFAQLLRMGESHAVPESHKVGILLASMGSNSRLESACAALRMKDIDSLSWDSVTADLIQEWRNNQTVTAKFRPSYDHDGGDSKKHKKALAKKVSKKK